MDDDLTPEQQRERDDLRTQTIRAFLLFYLGVATFGAGTAIWMGWWWITKGPDVHTVVLVILGSLMAALSYFGFRNDTAYIYSRMNKPLLYR